MRAKNKLKLYLYTAPDGRGVFTFEQMQHVGQYAGEYSVKLPPTARIEADLLGNVCVNGALLRCDAPFATCFWKGARKIFIKSIEKVLKKS